MTSSKLFIPLLLTLLLLAPPAHALTIRHSPNLSFRWRRQLREWHKTYLAAAHLEEDRALASASLLQIWRGPHFQAQVDLRQDSLAVLAVLLRHMPGGIVHASLGGGNKGRALLLLPQRWSKREVAEELQRREGQGDLQFLQWRPTHELVKRLSLPPPQEPLLLVTRN